MSKLWVKFGQSNATRVSTDGCVDIDDFIEAVKMELLSLYGEFPNGEISISLTEGGRPLRPGMRLNELYTDPVIENTVGHPLYISASQFQGQFLPLVELFVKNDNVITLSSELRAFIKGYQSIMIRDCYQELLNILLKKQSKKAVITGTSGIGKTLFLIYCAYALVVEMKKTVYLAINSAKYHYLVTPAGFRRCHNDSRELPGDAGICYLVDSLEPFIIDCGLSILTTVSPRMNYANESITYYMPLWDLNELVELVEKCKVNIDVVLLKKRFEILNGVPCRLFNTIFPPEKLIDYALSQSDIHSLTKSPLSERNLEHVSLLVLTTQDYINFEVKYASRYVSQRVYEYMMLQSEKTVYQFFRSSKQFSHLGSVRGSLYEYFAHDRLIAGGQFKRRRLDPDGHFTNMTSVTIPGSQEIVTQFASLDEGYEKKKKKKKKSQLHHKHIYFQPNDGFDSVDSWKQGVAMFQHTIGRNHDIKKLVHEVSRACKSSIFYFVVADEDIGRNFKYQYPAPPANGTPVKLEEYVLWIPVPENI
jgi:hypothetical protein